MATDSRIVVLGAWQTLYFGFAGNPGQMWRKESNIGAPEIKISRIKNEIVKNVIQKMEGSLNIPVFETLLLIVVIHFDNAILVNAIVVFITFISLGEFRDFL